MNAPSELDEIDPASLDQDGRIGRGIAALLKEREEAGLGLLNVSSMLEVMNKAGAESGATVQYKRRGGNGSDLFDPDEREIERANFQMQMAQIAKMVKPLPRNEKLAFSQEMRRNGNEEFARQAYGAAAELYMQSLAGLDFGDDAEAAAEARAMIQVRVHVLSLAGWAG